MVQNTTMSQASRVVLLSRSTLLCGDASAKDMKMLVDTLAGNFLAQQVSSICAVDSKSFVKETSGVLGDTSSYAERVKQEIVSGLAPNEANAIVSDAASKARGEALQLIGRLSVDGQGSARKTGELVQNGRQAVYSAVGIDIRYTPFIL